MKGPVGVGVSFGLTSGVITTLGLMVGLHSGTHSVLAVTGGVVTIAIADALSDALGIHVSEESKAAHPAREVWLATLTAFLAKFAVSMSFLVPILLLELDLAILVSVAWGLLVIAGLSHVLARAQGLAPWKVIGEHLTIALVVVMLTHWVGEWVAATFI